MRAGCGFYICALQHSGEAVAGAGTPYRDDELLCVRDRGAGTAGGGTGGGAGAACEHGWGRASVGDTACGGGGADDWGAVGVCVGAEVSGGGDREYPGDV